MFHPPGTTAEELDAFAEAKAAHDDDRFRVGPIKLYIDDVIEPHTAAMLEPYANRPDTRGETFYPPEVFAELIVELERRGFQTFTHATGDRGIRTVLDAVAHARRVHGPRDARHQIVHVECVHPDDLTRFAELGVVACMQPRHCAPEIVADWRANVGPERWPFAWPFRSLQAAGATLAFSSDWNVAEMDPLVWLYSACTRADLDGGEAWVPEETLDLPAAIRAATLGSAFANFAEGDRGSLTPGKYADVVVLSRDVFADGPAALLDTAVDVTIVGGEVVAPPRVSGGRVARATRPPRSPSRSCCCCCRCCCCPCWGSRAASRSCRCRFRWPRSCSWRSAMPTTSARTRAARRPRRPGRRWPT